MDLRYEHAHIIHADHDAAVAFYRDVLGAEVIDAAERKGAPQTKLAVGGSMFIVRGVRTGERPMPAGALPRMGVDHLGFYVGRGQLDEARRALGERGVAILEEDELPHLRYLYFAGPDGVVIELMEAK